MIKHSDIVASKANINRYVSMANKRIKRLEEKNLTDSPAYQKLVESGDAKFSVRGKTHNELQRELARLYKFVNAETSTIRGINNNLKQIASNTGIKFSTLSELRQNATEFFTLASKVEQYLRTVDDIASAIGYQKIWEAINTYVESSSASLGDISNDINSITQIVDRLITAPNHTMTANGDGWFQISTTRKQY